MRGHCWVGACVLCSLVSMSVIAASGEPTKDIIEGRIARFRDMGAAFKSIRDELKAARPDTSRIKDSARVVRNNSTAIPEWFPAGSEPPAESGWLDWVRGWFSSAGDSAVEPASETHAKAEIWANPRQFLQLQRQFVAEAAELWRVAQGADIAAIKAQQQKVARSCAACHKTFREPMD